MISKNMNRAKSELEGCIRRADEMIARYGNKTDSSAQYIVSKAQANKAKATELLSRMELIE